MLLCIYVNFILFYTTILQQTYLMGTSNQYLNIYVYIFILVSGKFPLGTYIISYYIEKKWFILVQYAMIFSRK